MTAIEVQRLLSQAVAQHQQGHIDDAARLYESILLSWPDTFDALHMLGVVALQRGRCLDAQRLINAALLANPLDVSAIGNLGTSYLRNGQRNTALLWFEIALKLKPDSETAILNMAAARQLDASQEQPDVAILMSAANVLLANGLNDDAIVQLHRAQSLDEYNLKIRWVAAMAILKPIYLSDREMTESRRIFSASLDEIKTWYDSCQQPMNAHDAVGAMQPFFLVYQPYSNREMLTRYGALCAGWMATLQPALAGPLSPASEAFSRFRLGIVSSHIREHSVWAALTKGWVQHIDRDRFELHLFHLNATVDEETLAAKATGAHFENRKPDLKGWIEAISSSNLDAIIYPEIGMDPTSLQLAALRLAPLQATSWGHPETSGLPTIDVYFSSDAMEARNGAENYSEKLVRLPNLGVYCEPLNVVASEVDLSALGLPTGERLLLCPGSPFKYAPLYDGVWAQIAKGLRKKLISRNSGGRLVFFRSQSEFQDRTLEARLRAAFIAAGVSFDARVCFVPYLERSQFYGLMSVSSLMLDTLGFSGFNTILQAVEAGLPMLTFEGQFLRGRLASGVMRRLELPELIATTADEFVTRALELVSQPRVLSELRQKIAGRRSRLFCDLTPVRALETYLLNGTERFAQ